MCSWLRQLVLCGLLCGICATVSASTVDASALSSRVLAQTGLDELLAQYPSLIKSGLRQNIRRVGMPSQVSRLFDDAIDGAFGSDKLNALVLERIEAGMSEQQMRDVLQWYRSPLGRKVTNAELRAMSGQEFDTLQTELESLTRQYAGTDRAQLFPAFDRATRATESMLDNALSVELAMAATLTALVKGPDLPTFEQLKQAIAERRTTLRGLVGQQVYLHYLYTYRHLSLEELESYISFARSESGTRYLEVVTSAVFEVLSERSEALGQRLRGDDTQDS